MTSDSQTDERGGSSVQRMVRLLALMGEETKAADCSPADRALWHLLTRWEADLPEMNDAFHRAFRQVDVTDSGHTDMAIWHLLSHSKLFWRLFERTNNDLLRREPERAPSHSLVGPPSHLQRLPKAKNKCKNR